MEWRHRLLVGAGIACLVPWSVLAAQDAGGQIPFFVAPLWMAAVLALTLVGILTIGGVVKGTFLLIEFLEKRWHDVAP
jgi:hypothetical protein